MLKHSGSSAMSMWSSPVATVDVGRRPCPGHERDLLVKRNPFLDDEIGIDELVGAID